MHNSLKTAAWLRNALLGAVMTFSLCDAASAADWPLVLPVEKFKPIPGGLGMKFFEGDWQNVHRDEGGGDMTVTDRTMGSHAAGYGAVRGAPRVIQLCIVRHQGYVPQRRAMDDFPNLLDPIVLARRLHVVTLTPLHILEQHAQLGALRLAGWKTACHAQEVPLPDEDRGRCNGDLWVELLYLPTLRKTECPSLAGMPPWRIFARRCVALLARQWRMFVGERAYLSHVSKEDRPISDRCKEYFRIQ
ncbi:MAG: hypothetical protein VW405_21825 [Rhodospirillaceae bacterium]